MTATAAESAAESAAAAGPRSPGRRERKKQRTRDALVDAAFARFAEKGFDATTVEEIAEAVDVSSRTFFRYFASKEDVALTFQEEQTRAVMAKLRERPADEPIMTALRHTVVSITRACERGELGFDPDRFEVLQRMMQESPALMAGSLEHAQQKQALITEVVAERLGLDPARELLPHVVAANAMCGLQAAAAAVHRHPETFTSLSETTDRAFALLEHGLGESARDQR